MKMNTTRIQYLIAGGVLATSAILGVPTAVAQPDNPADPGTPTVPGVPVAPNDVSCIAQPGNGVCAGQRSYRGGRTESNRGPS